jgi:Bifunctional DNA primase/polymerase, N-terminal
MENEKGRPEAAPIRSVNPHTDGDHDSTTCIVCGDRLDPVIRTEGFRSHPWCGVSRHAVALAAAGWAVFPLRGKYPPAGCTRCFVNLPAEGDKPAQRVEAHRKGECPHGIDSYVCHGVLCATNDWKIVAKWWTGRYRECNVAARVPAGLFVLDIDPRKPAVPQFSSWWPKLETLGVRSGRDDGGGHLYFQHPGGRLKAKIVEGLDVKQHSGYCVMPPSVHPATGQPYTWVHRPIMAPPDWLVEQVRQPKPEPATSVAPADRRDYDGDSIADQFSATATWASILTGWTVVGGDGETDGSRWRHPTATASWSATISNSCLFVYSPNTAFEQTEPGSPHGYTRFRAYAMLHHGGDLSAAWRHLTGLGVTVL